MNRDGIDLGPCEVFAGGERIGSAGDVRIILHGIPDRETWAEREFLWSRAPISVALEAGVRNTVRQFAAMRGHMEEARAVDYVAQALTPTRRRHPPRSTSWSLRPRPGRKLRRFPVPTRRRLFLAAARAVAASLKWRLIGIPLGASMGALATSLQGQWTRALEQWRQAMDERLERERRLLYGAPEALEPFGRMFAERMRLLVPRALAAPRPPLPELPPYRSPVHAHTLPRAPWRLRGTIPWHIRGRGR